MRTVSSWMMSSHRSTKNTFTYMQTEIMEIHSTALQCREDEAGQALSGEQAAIQQIVIVLINHLNFLWGYIRLGLLAIVSSKLFLRSSGARRREGGDPGVWNIADVYSSASAYHCLCSWTAQLAQQQSLSDFQNKILLILLMPLLQPQAVAPLVFSHLSSAW